MGGGGALFSSHMLTMLAQIALLLCAGEQRFNDAQGQHLTWIPEKLSFRTNEYIVRHL